jgi:hypothetical protein
MFTLLHRARRCKSNATGITRIRLKTTKRRRLNDWWQNCNYRHLLPWSLFSSGVWTWPSLGAAAVHTGEGEGLRLGRAAGWALLAAVRHAWPTRPRDSASLHCKVRRGAGEGARHRSVRNRGQRRRKTEAWDQGDSAMNWLEADEDCSHGETLPKKRDASGKQRTTLIREIKSVPVGERQVKPWSGSEIRQRSETWPEKLAEPSPKVRGGFLIWNQCVEDNTGIYIGLGFGNISQFLNFRIILIPWIK